MPRHLIHGCARFGGVRTGIARFAALVVTVGSLVGSVDQVASADELAARRAALGRELRQALDTEERWLGTGEDAARWRAFLRSEELRAQLASDGDSLDLVVLCEVKARYQGGTPGLEHPRFVDVRTALDRWMRALPNPTPVELAHLARSAADRQGIINSSPVEASRNSLTEAHARLNDMLNRSPRHGPGWRSHLLFDELEAELAAPGALDDDRLDAVLARYVSGHPGLELAEFAAVRSALDEYRRDRRAARLENAQSERRACLERLAEHLERDGVRRRSRSLEGIAEALAWLDRHGFAPSVVEVVRRRYAQPNLYAQIAGEAFAAQFERELKETFPVRSVISGARVTGSGRLTGQLSFELVPDADRASFRMFFDGDIQTVTTARSGPVGIDGRGRTRLAGEKRLYIDEHAVHALPASTSANTSLSVDGVWSTFRGPLLDGLARRAGAKRNAASRASNERSVSRQAEQDLERRFEAEAAALLDTANEAYVAQFRVPFHKYGIFPSDLRFSTTADHLCLRATLAEAGQLAALTSPPELDPHALVSLVVHESLFNNLVATTLSGRTLESHELADVLEQLVGSAPNEFETVDGVPWALTVAEAEPLEIGLSEEGVAVSIRCQRIDAGAEKFDIPFAVSTRYRPAIDGDAIVFHRVDDLQVASPVGFGKLNDGLTDSQAVIAERFEMLLQPELRFTLDQLPFELPIDADLVPTDFTTTEGWVRLNMNAREPNGAESLAAQSVAE